MVWAGSSISITPKSILPAKGHPNHEEVQYEAQINACLILSVMNFSQRLRTAIDETEPRLRAFAEAAAALRPDGGAGWSRKQELGHLVDSAANNRARFINAALAGQYAGPSYDGDGWVTLGGYANMAWTDVVGLWTALNRALAIVLDRIPPERLPAPC